MTGFESKQSSRGDKDLPDPDQLSVDFGPLFRATFSNGAIETEDKKAQASSQPGQTSPSPSPPPTGKPPPARQLLLQFPPDCTEATLPQGSPPSHPEGSQDAVQDDSDGTPQAAHPDTSLFS